LSKDVVLRVKEALYGSKSVGENISELAYEPQVIAVESLDGQLVEVLAEQAQVVKKREAANHCISFRLVGTRVESRNGAAAVGEAVADVESGSESRPVGGALRRGLGES
jgi:hypothetical protein